MRFTHRSAARRFTTRISRLPNLSAKSHQSHPFTASSGFNRRRFWIRFFGLVSTLVFVSIIGLIIFTLFSFVIFAKDLPSPNKLSARDSSLSTKIFDRNGKLLYDIYGDKNRALVKWGELPSYVKESTIAIEDKDFYKHRGFSFIGIA